MRKYRFLLVSLIAIIFVLSSALTPRIIFAVGPAVAQTVAQNGQSVSTINTAFGSNTVAGNKMIVFAECTGTCSALTISDSQGNTFALITSNAIGSTFFVNTYYVINIKSSAADTITWSGGQSETNLGFEAIEISGVTSIGYLASSGGNNGVNCGCSTGSLTIPSNAIALAGMNSNGNAGSFTFTGSFTGINTPSNSLLAAEYSTSVIGASTFTTSYSNPLNGWAENSVILNIAAPADFNVVLNAGGSASPNSNTVNITCTINYVFSGDTLLVILGIAGAGNTLSTPSDSIGSTFTSQYSAGSGQNPEIIAYIAGISKDAVIDTITQKDVATGGHGALQESCYEIQGADIGSPLTLTVLKGNSTGPPTGCNSNTFCNVPEAGGSVGLFGTSCSSANCINDVIYSASGSGVVTNCPTLLTFKNANTQSGNTAGAGDSNVHASCLSDPGSSNKLIQVDNYGSASGFSTGTTPYTAISNITTGNLIAGAGFGAIFGFAPNVVVTQSVTAWNTIDPSTPANWIITSVMLIIFPAGFWGAIKAFKAKPSTTVFATLLGLFAGSIIATIGGFELGANAFYPMGLTVFNGGLFVIYMIRARSRSGAVTES